MSITGNWDRRRLSRRDFLAMSGMGATALALGTQGLLLPSRAWAASYYPSSLGNPFTLGVASGHPDEKGAVLWTRLAPTPLSGGGMGKTGDVYVDWEVATGLSSDGTSLQNVVLSSRSSQNPAIAYKSEAHSVHLEVGVDTVPLQAGQTYYYRFMVSTSSGGTTKYASPIGRTKTTPALGDPVTKMAFALVSCQHLESGYYHAYRDIAARAAIPNPDPELDLDLVVHLGDYLYEDWPSDGWARKYKTKQPTNLSTYRNRHAEYKSENPQLRDAHRLYPWLCTWDDHEFVNNYAGDVDSNTRRDAAYQAYYEHMPLRKAFRKPKPWRDVTLFGHVAYGNLAQFCMLDTRQFRSDQPCSGSLPDTDCTQRFDQTRRMLDRPSATSEAQLNWLLNDRLSPSTADDHTWNVLANQVIMFELLHRYDEDNDGKDESYYVDGWDGYAHARSRLLEHLAQKGAEGNPIVPNPIVLTGDMHASFASDLKHYASDWKKSFRVGDEAQTVGAEFTGTSVTSWLGWPADEDPDGWKAIWKKAFEDRENPHLKYYDDRQGGYLLCTLNGTQWQTHLRTVNKWDDVEKSGEVALTTRATLTVNAGQPGIAQVSKLA